MTFWNILNYSIWKRLIIDNESLSLLEEELSGVMNSEGPRKLINTYIA
jgi:hypothetical protein